VLGSRNDEENTENAAFKFGTFILTYFGEVQKAKFSVDTEVNCKAVRQQSVSSGSW